MKSIIILLNKFIYFVGKCVKNIRIVAGNSDKIRLCEDLIKIKMCTILHLDTN